MNKIKTIKIKNEDGSVSEESYSIAADALNIDMTNGKNVQETIGTIDVDKDGNIAAQLNKKINKSDIIDNLDSSDNNKVLSAKQGKVLNEAVAAANLDIQKKIYYFNTIEDMKTADLQAGDTCQTLGYYSVNDDGAGLYKIVDDDTLVDDGGSIHDLENGLKAELIVKDSINLKQFGAKGDGLTDDTTKIQTAFNYIGNTNIKKIVVDIGLFYITNTLSIPNNICIEGINNNCMPFNNTKYSGFLRKSNFNALEIVGQDYSVSGGTGISNVQINNITLITDSNNYCSNPFVRFFRTVYNRFTNVNFHGNGKSIFFDKGVFDCRFNNCEFTGNSDIETLKAESDTYHSAGWYGTNQIFFIGCRWEGYTKGKIIHLQDHTHDISFISCKWEGDTADDTPVLCGEGTTGNIIFDDCHLTIHDGSICSLLDFEQLLHGKLNFYLVDNRQSILSPFMKIGSGNGIDLNLNGTFDISAYQSDYYIENTNTLYFNSLKGNILLTSYYNPNRIRTFKNSELQNEAKTIYSSTNVSSYYTQPMNIKLNKSEDKTQAKTWQIFPSYANYTNDVTQINIISPNGNNIMNLQNGRVQFPWGLLLPYLTAQPSYLSNGDIMINKYTDSNTPVLQFTIEDSSKRIGFATQPPSSRKLG